MDVKGSLSPQQTNEKVSIEQSTDLLTLFCLKDPKLFTKNVYNPSV